jgi:chaperone required for assembly of F1-ATPase
LAQAAAAYDPLVLAGLGVAVPALGSLVLGLAMAAGALDADKAHDLATLDELFQEELWGRDAEAAARRAKVAAELHVAGRFMTLAQTVDA